MKFNFTICQVNSPFSDTAFMVNNTYKKRPFLLDCGRLGNRVGNTDILNIAQLFVSHTHMDHFYGFDRIIRSSLNFGKSLSVFGPPGIIKNIKGKLDGYTWNLVNDYDFALNVVELNPDNAPLNASMIRANTGFQREDYIADDSIFDIGEGFHFGFEFFDHKIPSVGYRIYEPDRISVDSEKLINEGFKPGIWIKGFKKACLLEKLDEDIEADTLDGIKTYKVGDILNRIASRDRAQSITYITDIAPSRANIEKAIRFASNSDLLMIEAMFLDEDFEHACYKGHLTVGKAKEIFFESRASRIKFFHYSSRYEVLKQHFYSALYSGMDGKILKD